MDSTAFTILPNDYDDVITGGRNTALDLIRAPLAWTITRGENQLIGVSDTWINDSHEELVGKVEIDIDVPHHPNLWHGAGVSGMAVAKTNNGYGVSSIAHETKIASIPNIGMSRVELLAEVLLNESSGTKVINASWGSCRSTPSIYDQIAYQSLLDNNVLIVAAGGNDFCPEGTLHYPAAYDATLSVTTVGHRVAPTYYHNILNPDGTIAWHRSWKDVYRFRPDSQTNMSGHNLRANIDVTAPGQLLVGLTVNYADYPSGYRLLTATSPSTPIVTGLAALIIAASPNLSAQQVKDMIRDTADDIYDIPYNQPFIGLLGTGRINAYRAVLTSKCMADSNYEPNLDLMVRNSMVDYGYEPDDNTEEIFWNSQDIWIRQNSGESYIDVHQNPEYDPVVPNYVNVRVTNRSCVTSSGNEDLKLYWSKANTALSWPAPWDGSITVGNNIPLGGAVGTLKIPPLDPGQEAILEFEWLIPNPADYVGLNPNPWHFCLLARIDTPDDPMTNEGMQVVVTENVRNNNNIG